MREALNVISLSLIPFLIVLILFYGLIKRVPCYEVFVSGAKEGLYLAFKILPYLVAIVVSVSMFRASGAIDLLTKMLSPVLEFLKIPVDTFALMITRSISGSASLGIFSDIVNSSGANSFAAKLSAVIVGSSETTFYVLSVYFGSVGIKKMRYALLLGLLADAFGVVMAIFVSKYFFS